MRLYNWPLGIQELKEYSFRKESTMGYPDLKNEAWKYTPVSRLLKEKFEPLNERAYSDALSIPEELQGFVGENEISLIFYNGQFVEHLSSQVQNEEIFISSFSQLMKTQLMSTQQTSETTKERELLISALSQEGSQNLGVFSQQHQAAFDEGVFVNIKGQAKPGSIHKINLISIYGNLFGGKTKSFSCFPRLVIQSEKNTSSEIFDFHIGVNDISFLSSGRIDLILKENSFVSLATCKWLGQESSLVQDFICKSERDSQLELFELSHGGKLIRNELDIKLIGPGAGVKSLGAYLGKDKNHIDNSTSIYHGKPNTQSAQVYKGILKDSSEAVFTGHLLIELDAQKSDASQLNQTVLLSDEAQINTRPQLEVFADDVKAAHGATVGSLEVEPIFYLMSRGFSEAEARKALAKSHISDVVKELKSENLKIKLRKIIDQIFSSYFQEA